MKIHIARAGDTLWQLAQKYNIPIERIREANPALADTDELKAGEKIRIPMGKVPVVSTQQSKTWEEAASPSLEEGETVVEQEREETGAPFSALPTPPQVPDIQQPEVFQWGSSSPWDSPFFEGEWEEGPPGYYPPPMPPYPAFVYGHWPAFPPAPYYPTAYPSPYPVASPSTYQPAYPAFYPPAHEAHVPVEVPLASAAYPMIQEETEVGGGGSVGSDAIYDPSSTNSPLSHDPEPGKPAYQAWYQPQAAQVHPAKLKESSSTLA
jgi:morphogenetic protein associated with SpoVID